MPDEAVSTPDSSQGAEQMSLFGDLATGYDSTNEGAAAEVPQAAAGVAESSVQPAVEAPPPPAAPSTQQTATQQPPPAPEQPQAPPQQQYWPTTEEILQRRQAYLEQLARQYSVPEDQIDTLATEPHKVLPNIAANLALNTYEAVTQYFNSMMPQYIAHIVQQQNLQRTSSERFFEQWPQLRSEDPNVMKTIGTVAIAYRRANPTASVDEAISKVGAASAAMLGMAPTPKNQPRTPTARPFSHSAPGVASNSMPASEQRGNPSQSNFFTELVNGLDLSEI